MGCASGCVRWLLFFVNFLFALGGLAILIVGVLIELNKGDVLAIFEGNVPSQLTLPATVLIAVGAIIFIIAFFGCCGAARESHCMIVTFAVLLLTLLVIQVTIAGFAFIKMNEGTFDEDFNKQLKNLYDRYFQDKPNDHKATEATVNSIQTLMGCCGFNSPADFRGPMPYSCCGKPEHETCAVPDHDHLNGCESVVLPKIHKYMNTLGSLALAIAAVELFGVIFSFCLANSIRNVERRGYKV
ncbi:tetraspanin-18-like isoform X2 [Phymastichus coffea]|uniref:tetraspanin-18-like isoform X2 n=1 Tax=Phymastichus coffea TaxID=108790 RepID=UPI00273BEEB8|nr:tetraspanin-18-like isoform X2 [Phymastichus coffea]